MSSISEKNSYTHDVYTLCDERTAPNVGSTPNYIVEFIKGTSGSTLTYDINVSMYS